ncbi:WhiB family transcriptional regulator [Nocardia sp. NPDC050630]|uniref:WhiB family transcriptional regulator n=1 Tax=Nocardia sp. NPDC050630 TaxID=3364321 RepID=UPI003796835E
MAELPKLDEIRADPVSPADADRARLEVVRRAENADDARQLLAMLGLDSTPPRKARSSNRDWPSNLSRAKAPAKPAPAAVIQNPEWSDLGACRGYDPELWFSDVGSDSAAEAKRICYGCPVRRDCGEAARKRGERHSIVAGFHTGDPAEWQKLWVWLGLKMPEDQQRALKSRELICSECGDPFTTQRRNGTRCVPCMQNLVEIGPVAEHIAALGAHEHGMNPTQVARAANVSQSVVAAVAKGRQQYIGRDKAERIMALRLDAEVVSG